MPSPARSCWTGKSETPVKAIHSLSEQSDLLKTNPVGDQELARAKDTILNNFVFNFDTPGKVLQERMAYEYYGYPADFLERYRSGIEKVTTADVARLAAKDIHNDQLAILVAGNSDAFHKPLSSLRAVPGLDITIPPPPGGTDEKGTSGAAAGSKDKDEVKKAS